MPSNKASNIFALLHDLTEEKNAHDQGTKRVFINQNKVKSALTQFAHGKLTQGEMSGLHSHATMDEYFYFISGAGLFTIDGENIPVRPETFIRVPATLVHNLQNQSEEPLKFVYFGIAL